MYSASASNSLSTTDTVHASDSDSSINERTVHGDAISRNPRVEEDQAQESIQMDALPMHETKRGIFDESNRKRISEHPLFAMLLLVGAGTAVAFQSGFNGKTYIL